MKLGRFAALALLLMTACRSETETKTTTDRLPDAEEEVQAAALKWAFGSVDTNLDPPAAYCIALQDSEGAERRDPPSTLLGRLQAAAAPVRPVSECRFGGTISDGLRDGLLYEAGTNVVFDRITQGPALYFGIFPVRWDSGGVAIINVDYLQGGLWGAGYECRVENQQGVWGVTGCEKTYES